MVMVGGESSVMVDLMSAGRSMATVFKVPDEVWRAVERLIAELPDQTSPGNAATE
jgi:hypothetical protein